MKSQGTKETQGINGDAAQLQRQLDAAAAVLVGDVTPCPYRRHREIGLDWFGDGARVVCGFCHPSARGLEVELVAASSDRAAEGAVAR